MRYILLSAMLVLIVDRCTPAPDDAEQPPPIRGLVTKVVEPAEATTTRRYPGVLEPGEVNVLSFEVGGRLGPLNLVVGQRIAEGAVLGELSAEQFQAALDSRRAAVEEAQATLDQAEDDLERSDTLLASGTITRVRRDEDATDAATARARLVQAQKDLATAEEDLRDATLYAPFDAIVNAIEVDSFATVAAGEPVISVYSEDNYEVEFSVNFDVVSRLVVGKPATVRLADDPSTSLKGVVTELGERAETVSSFPVVVELEETDTRIKPGMAVEVALEFEGHGDSGFLVPISAAIPEGEIPTTSRPDDPTPLQIYVFDPETSTIARRTVTFAGLRENQFVVIDGLTSGERVAVAGVSFLADGMEVKLVDRPE